MPRTEQRGVLGAGVGLLLGLGAGLWCGEGICGGFCCGQPGRCLSRVLGPVEGSRSPDCSSAALPTSARKDRQPRLGTFSKVTPLHQKLFFHLFSIQAPNWQEFNHFSACSTSAQPLSPRAWRFRLRGRCKPAREERVVFFITESASKATNQEQKIASEMMFNAFPLKKGSC